MGLEDRSKDGTIKLRILEAADEQSSTSSAVTPVEPTQDELPVDSNAKPGTVTRTLDTNLDQPTTTWQRIVRTSYDVAALSRLATLPQMPDTLTEFDAITTIASEFLDSNPRRIKRLLNTYRYIKILGAGLPGSQVQTDDWQQTMLYWLAFTMKWPSFMSEAIEVAEQRDPKDLTDDDFLIDRLRKGSKQFQPEERDIKKYLRLTAKEVLEHYQLAPNFLIENPGTDQNQMPRQVKSNGNETAQATSASVT